jgi:hypothetical protein
MQAVWNIKADMASYGVPLRRYALAYWLVMRGTWTLFDGGALAVR